MTKPPEFATLSEVSPSNNTAQTQNQRDDSNSLSPRRPRRVMICVRGQCAEPSQGRRLEEQLLRLIQQHGLDDPDHPQHISCTVTNCLGVCLNGPILIVHPDIIKYQHIDAAALDRIFQEHLLQGRPVEGLIVRQPPSRPIFKNAKRK